MCMIFQKIENHMIFRIFEKSYDFQFFDKSYDFQVCAGIKSLKVDLKVLRVLKDLEVGLSGNPQTGHPKIENHMIFKFSKKSYDFQKL